MILESLLELVETLKVRIDEHGDQLRQSEWLTRYALIDPLLRELGWETDNPSLVIPEYQSGHGRADYALFGDGKPVMMVEAKKLGTQLRDSVLSQGIQYCLEKGTKHFSVTDGQRWEVYETHKPVPIDEKRVVEFDLKHPSSAEVCLKALALWRLLVQSDHAALEHEPVVSPTESVSVSPSATVTTIPPIGDEHEWHSLIQLNAIRDKKPTGMMFPDGGRTQFKHWEHLPVEAVRWLIAKGILNSNHCPIMGKNPGTTRYIVHSQPNHSNGTPFKKPVNVDGVYVETHGNSSGPFRKSSTGFVNRTKVIIESVGQDPAQFSVRFS